MDNCIRILSQSQNISLLAPPPIEKLTAYQSKLMYAIDTSHLFLVVILIELLTVFKKLKIFSSLLNLISISPLSISFI